MTTRNMLNESNAVFIGGVIALAGYIVFYIVAFSGMTDLLREWGGRDPTPLVVILLLVTFLPGPTVAGYLQTHSLRSGVRDGIYAAFLGIVVPFAYLFLDEILSTVFASGGPDAILFDRGFIGSLGSYGVLAVVVLGLTGTMGGIIGGLARKLKMLLRN